MQSKLYDTVLDLVSNRDGKTLKEVADETGVGYHWLCSFAAKRIPNPSVRAMETLYVYFTGKALEL